MKRGRPFWLAAMAGVLAVNGYANLVITPTFDSNITTDPNGTSIENTINAAIGQYESMFSNNITVSIYFQEMTAGLGQSDTVSYLLSYTSFFNGLIGTNANPAAFAALVANGGGGSNNPVTSTGNIDVKSADARAVGIGGALPACTPTPTTPGTPFPTTCTPAQGPNAVDGIISLNPSITSPPGPSSNYGLLAVVEHEIDEVLGLGSSLNNCNPGDPNATAECKAAGSWTFSTPGATAFANTPAPEDLYRWTAASGGTRSTGTDCQAGPFNAFFNYGPSTGNIAQFNNACNGADFGDWINNTSPNTQDAFGTAGANPSIGTEEVAALTAIGYEQAAPEPASFGLLGLSLVGLAVMRHRAAK